MKTQLLRKLYDYISFFRHELPNLCRLLDFSVDAYSAFDSSLKIFLTAIDDEILKRQQHYYFELDSKYNLDKSDEDIKPTEDDI